MKYFRVAFTALPLIVSQAYAHHNYQAVFDNSKEITLNGTITDVSWRSPHIEYSIETPSLDGSNQIWLIPTAAPRVAHSNQLSKGTIEKGDLVTFSGWPARNGTQSMRALKVTTEDGTTYRLQPNRKPRRQGGQ